MGYDVRLGYRGLPIYLQFKLSDWLSRGRAKYLRYYRRPYYRIPIASRRRSNQHNLLKDLADAGEEHIYYVAPLFHRLEEFNDAYVANQMTQRSNWFPLHGLPRLVDDEEHDVTFNDSSSFNWHTLEGEHYLEGKRIDLDVSAGRLLATVQGDFERGDLRRIDSEFVRGLRAKLLSGLAEQGVLGLPRLPAEMPSLVDGLRDIRFLLTTFYSVAMVILRRAP